MSTTVETNMNHPFDWMVAKEWMWMAEMTDGTDYMYMDDLYRVIRKDITREEFIELWGKAPKDFKEEYRKGFPDLIASCLEGLAEEIREGRIEFDINFNE